MILTVHAPRDGHAVYSVGLNRSAVKARLNGHELPSDYDGTSGLVTLRQRPSYFDPERGSVISGDNPIKRGDRIEVSWA
jgi:hypothetical protein